MINKSLLLASLAIPDTKELSAGIKKRQLSCLLILLTLHSRRRRLHLRRRLGHPAMDQFGIPCRFSFR